MGENTLKNSTAENGDMGGGKYPRIAQNGVMGKNTLLTAENGDFWGNTLPKAENVDLGGENTAWYSGEW